MPSVVVGARVFVVEGDQQLQVVAAGGANAVENLDELEEAIADVLSFLGVESVDIQEEVALGRIDLGIGRGWRDHEEHLVIVPGIQ